MLHSVYHLPQSVLLTEPGRILSLINEKTLFFFFFDPWSHCVALADLELYIIQAGLLSAGIKDVHHCIFLAH